MNLTCPACGSPFSADDVHVELGVANGRSASRSTRATGRTVIEWRWFRAARLVMIPFAIFWWGFLIAWYSSMLQHPAKSLMPILFPLLHVGAGVAVVYSILTNLLNRTRIVADDGGITVSHGPMPWPGRHIDRVRLSSSPATGRLAMCRRRSSAASMSSGRSSGRLRG